MNEKQTELILKIIREQLDDYLAGPLVEDILDGINEGLYDNQELIEKLAED